MTTQQLQNLKALRDLGRRILAEPEKYALGFGQVDCGTYACLIGWYARERNDIVAVGAVLPEISAYHSGKAAQYFGISADQSRALFDQTALAADRPGPAAYAELERRLAYLDQLIAEREPKPKPLPESVTRLFEAKETA